MVASCGRSWMQNWRRMRCGGASCLPGSGELAERRAQVEAEARERITKAQEKQRRDAQQGRRAGEISQATRCGCAIATCGWTSKAERANWSRCTSGPTRCSTCTAATRRDSSCQRAASSIRCSISICFASSSTGERSSLSDLCAMTGQVQCWRRILQQEDRRPRLEQLSPSSRWRR